MKTFASVAAVLIALPGIAAAQSSLVVTPTGMQNGQPAASMSDVLKSGQGKVDGESGTANNLTHTGETEAQGEAIANSIVSSTYLGGLMIPQPNLHRLTNGHLQLLGQPGSWGSQTNLLTIEANEQYQNNGNQGNFWDPAYRLNYGGQDQGAAYISIQARTPELLAASTASFGTSTIATPTGNRTVYTVTLATPMTLLQMTDLATRPPNSRVEINNGFFAYLIAPGQVSPSGGTVPPVSADGRTLTVDNWVCASCSPQVPSSANALPNSVGSAPYTLTLDVTHQIDVLYGGASVSDADQVTDVNGNEFTFANFKTSPAKVNLNDPLLSTLTNGQAFRLFGRYGGVVSGSNNGVPINGTGTAHDVAGAGWNVGFVARNPQIYGSQGSTYGFLVPQQGPTWGLYSTQASGFVIGVDPNDSCSVSGGSCNRTFLVDVAGNVTSKGAGNFSTLTSQAGLIAHVSATVDGQFAVYNAAGTGNNLHIDGESGNLTSNGSGTFNGLLTAMGGEQVNGMFAVYNSAGTGNNFHVDGASGNVTTNGSITAALATPASSTAPCFAGQMEDDTNYHYVCVASNTWKRIALTSF